MADAVAAHRRADPLGVRRVLGDRLLPVMVATMAFLAALALGGAVAAQAWASRWRTGAGTALTAQVPQPADPVAAMTTGGPVAEAPVSRLDAALRVLRSSSAIAAARPLSAAELDGLLRPWLGTLPAMPDMALPAVIAVRAAPDLSTGNVSIDQLADTLAQAVPGATLERHEAWVARLSRLLGALEACAWGALLVVTGAATLVVATATRAGLVARRSSVDILHGLGATDSFVARRFALRAMGLAGLGGILGTLAALPALVSLDDLARPFANDGLAPNVAADAGTWYGLPLRLWVGLALIPPSAAAIGYATAQGTVRVWLRRLP